MRTGTAGVLHRTLASCSFVPRISVHTRTAMSVMPLSCWLLLALAIRAGSNSWPCMCLKINTRTQLLPGILSGLRATKNVVSCDGLPAFFRGSA